jgi:alginate O-acetyltransferase complex protein AlgI
MLFNSIYYLALFLPFTWLVYQGLGRNQLKNTQLLWLVLASLFFYASWNPIYLLLILSSVIVNFFMGEFIHKHRSSPVKYPALAITIGFNLLLLGYFKYTGFFLDNLNSIIGTVVPSPHIILPLAISFFTFQQIAYQIDVARGEAKDYSFTHYCLFVTFFPQLLAGPIVHHKEMMPQFDKLNRTNNTRTNLQVGITIIAMGLFKKVVLADSLAQMANPIFNNAESGLAFSSVEAWVAVLAFTGQIYFDFSGYTDMAIGSARLFGIILPENFFSPYKANNIIEFWRRWHITLSRFLRDYLYISLGGNRQGRINRYRNLLITMLLGGLWHGAHWNFVIWGGLHGSYLILNHFWRYSCRQLGVLSGKPSRPLQLIYRLTTLLAVIVAWVFFRAESTSGALQLLSSMFIYNGAGFSEKYLQAIFQALPFLQLTTVSLNNAAIYTGPLAILFAALSLCLFAPNTQQIMANYQPVLSKENREVITFRLLLWRPSLFYAGLTAVVFYLSLISISSVSEFIYFQF